MIVPSDIELIPVDPEFNPSDKEFDSGMMILSLQILMIKSTNRKIGMIYRNTGQYSLARLVPDVFSTVHESKYKFHLQNYCFDQCNAIP